MVVLIFNDYFVSFFMAHAYKSLEGHALSKCQLLFHLHKRCKSRPVTMQSSQGISSTFSGWISSPVPTPTFSHLSCGNLGLVYSEALPLLWEFSVLP